MGEGASIVKMALAAVVCAAVLLAFLHARSSADNAVDNWPLHQRLTPHSQELVDGIQLTGSFLNVSLMPEDVFPNSLAKRTIKLTSEYIFVMEAAPVETTTNTTVLLFHGQKYSSETWRKTGTYTALAQAGFRSFGFDLPGFGRSVGSTPEILKRVLARALVKAFGHGGKVVVVAPSMAGSYVLPMLAKEPVSQQRALVAGLVAVAPVGTASLLESSDELSRWDVRALLVAGDKDEAGGQAAQRLSRIPGSRVLTLRDAGHACYVDQPAAFNAALVEFVTAVDLDQ